MADWLLDSLTDSGNNPIELHPSRDYTEGETGRRTQHLYTGGNQQIAYWPTRKQWTVPVTWINSLDASRIQTWWENGDSLSWTLSESSSPSTYTVQLANQEKPLQKYHVVNRDQFQGVLMLEAVNNDAAAIQGTFILEDDVFGLLDTDGNLLG